MMMSNQDFLNVMALALATGLVGVAIRMVVKGIGRGKQKTIDDFTPCDACGCWAGPIGDNGERPTTCESCLVSQAYVAAGEACYMCKELIDGAPKLAEERTCATCKVEIAEATAHYQAAKLASYRAATLAKAENR